MANAPDIYRKLVRDLGMPRCATLVEMNGLWYETPEDVSPNADDPVGTAVFKPLPPNVAADRMADHAARWAGSFMDVSRLPEEPTARLEGVARAARQRG